MTRIAKNRQVQKWLTQTYCKAKIIGDDVSKFPCWLILKPTSINLSWVQNHPNSGNLRVNWVLSVPERELTRITSTGLDEASSFDEANFEQ